MTNQEVINQMKACRIVREILNKGLARSTWRDQYRDAYDDLLRLRPDMEASVALILNEAQS